MRKIFLLLTIVSFAWTQSFDYVGTNGCKTCHKSSKKGAQYVKWSEGPHANAFETLKSAESAKIAQEMGLKVAAYEAPECLSCHATGYGNGGYEVKDASFWDQKTEKGKPTRDVKRMAGLQSVSCEACHGPGKSYKSSKKMKAIFIGKLDGKTVGLEEQTEQTCLVCHNEKSPTYVKFDYIARSKEMAHPISAEMRKELHEKYSSK